MLSQRDVENIFNRVDGDVDWEYWRDSGHYNCWFLAEGDWMLQVSHMENVLAINDQRDDDGYEMATVGYDDDHLAITLVALTGMNPDEAYQHLRDLSTSTVVNADITHGQN
jgi:hypothetical protein